MQDAHCQASFLGGGTIRAVCFHGPGQVMALDVSDPTIQDSNDAIVEVAMAGLCGSDLHVFHGREIGMDRSTVMGHELVGRIVDKGSGVHQHSVGDRVFAPFTTNCGECHFCRMGMTARCEKGQLFGWVSGGKGLQGCQSQFVRVPLADGTLKSAPDGLSDEAALLLADNFSTGYYCAEMANVNSDGVYVVIGCGNVGLLAIVAAKDQGATTIIAVDPVAERRQAAERRGATVGVTPEAAKAEVASRSENRGADAVLELVGLPQAQRLAFELIRAGGTMAVVGCHCTEHFSFSPVEAFDKNLTYRTGRCSARHYMDLLTPKAVAATFPLDSFVTHYFSFDECVDAYDLFSNYRDGCIKAVFVSH